MYITQFMGAVNRNIYSNKYGMNFVDIEEVVSFCNLTQEEQFLIFNNTINKIPSFSPITVENLSAFENVGSLRVGVDFRSKDQSNLDSQTSERSGTNLLVPFPM